MIGGRAKNIERIRARADKLIKELYGQSGSNYQLYGRGSEKHIRKTKITGGRYSSL